MPDLDPSDLACPWCGSGPVRPGRGGKLTCAACGAIDVATCCEGAPQEPLADEIRRRFVRACDRFDEALAEVRRWHASEFRDCPNCGVPGCRRESDGR